METFTYRDGVLHAEDVSVAELAADHGTPLYIYSRSHLIDRYQALAGALEPLNPLIFFAVKSNTNGAVIQTLGQQGAGADVVSGGELYRAMRSGIDPKKIAFAGVGKTRDDIEYALLQDILYFTVESEAELDRISACAEHCGQTGRIAIRVNPDVDPKTHKYTSTGKKENKFGVDIERALRAYERAAALPGLEIAGLHMHLGSPIMTVDPYVEALEKVMPICAELKQKYDSFAHLDIGGGMGIAYREDQHPFTPREFADAVMPYLSSCDLNIGLEPGRFITGNAGILVTEVQYLKENPFKTFVIVDAAMNDLIRPALYEAHHDIVAVRETSERLHGDVVGPICESGDFFAADRELPAVAQGDLLAIRSAGAYGFVMASNYNSRGLPAEVMVQGHEARLVRDRQNWEDLVDQEHLPTW